MKPLALSLLAILTALRLCLAQALAVTPLEAYYWMCSRRLDWAFFDGPPGTAWLVSLGTSVLGDGPLGLRLLFPLLAAAASIGAFLLGRGLFGSVAGLWAAVALNALPVFNIAAIHAGPEIPTLTLLLFAGWALLRALESGFTWWIVCAVFLALAMQFHYAAVLFLGGVFVICIFSRKSRLEWGRAGIYGFLIISVCGLLPALLWNQANYWPALALGTLNTALTPRWGEIGPALLTVGPLFSLTALAAGGFAIWSLSGATAIHAKPRVTLALFFPFFAFWLYQVFLGQPAPLFLLLAFGVLLGGVAHVFLAAGRLRQLGAVLLLLTTGLTVFASSTRAPDKNAREVSWREVAASLDELLAKAQPSQAAPLLVIAQDPDATASLNYHLRGTAHSEVFLRESQDASNQFALWPRYDDFVATDKPVDDFFKQEGNTTNPYLGRSALYLSDETPRDLPQTITGAFRQVTSFATLQLAGGRKLRVYLCEDYQTMPL